MQNKENSVMIPDYPSLKKAKGKTCKDLHESGLIEELSRRQLIPDKIKNIDSSCDNSIGFEIAVPLVYPFEWSPEMARRAALCILKVNECANDFGYELKDVSPCDVTFVYNQPFFLNIDNLGKLSKPGFWSAQKSFNNQFLRSLRFAQDGLIDLYKLTFGATHQGVSFHEFLACKHSLLFRVLGIEAFKTLQLIGEKYQNGPVMSEDEIRSIAKKPFIYPFVKFVLQSKFMTFRSNRHRRLVKRIAGLKLYKQSGWASYQESAGIRKDRKDFKLSDRMTRVLELVKELSPRTVLELAGNQGILSRAIAVQCPSVTSVICSDYDVSAIDSLVCNIQPNEKVTPACFDFMSDIRELITGERAVRLQSELVLALAVTHHLTLSQKYPLENIFETLYKYTSNHLIVEFMPLGLWDGSCAAKTPDWYTERWFAETMSLYFEIIKKERLEKNRLMFLGKKRLFTTDL